MAEKLKHYFDASLVRGLARELHAAHPAFDERGFVAASVAGLDELELTARAYHVAEALHRHLPQPFARAADVIVASLGPELERTEGFGFAPFRYLPHVFFVQRHGLDDFEAAMRLQHELTRRFTAEFSIRAFLEAHPAATLERLRVWASDPSVHVRRLVSEGTRPRLPWAPRLRGFQADPRPVIALLELLKDDPERYVQRSVANSLNDIAKDHPELCVEVCQRWLDAPSEGRSWIVKHALRSLVKDGHRGALALMGVGGKPRVRLGPVTFSPAAVKLGQKLGFSVELASTARAEQELLVDYAVHFVKASGDARPKVFKLKKLVLAPGGRVELSGRVSFAPMTTRRPQPGRHRIELLINGFAHPLGEFDVAAGR